jgi:hypothetical protein
MTAFTRLHGWTVCTRLRALVVVFLLTTGLGCASDRLPTLDQGVQGGDTGDAEEIESSQSAPTTIPRRDRSDFAWTPSGMVRNEQWGYTVAIPQGWQYGFGQFDGGLPRLWLRSAEYEERWYYDSGWRYTHENGAIMDLLVACARPGFTIDDLLDGGGERPDQDLARVPTTTVDGVLAIERGWDGATISGSDSLKIETHGALDSTSGRYFTLRMYAAGPGRRRFLEAYENVRRSVRWTTTTPANISC